jgi:hypothetical protein
MDFVRSYFFTNEPLTSWTLFSSKLDLGLSVNLILMKKVFNCSEVHSQRSNKIHTLIRHWFILVYILKMEYVSKINVFGQQGERQQLLPSRSAQFGSAWASTAK